MSLKEGLESVIISFVVKHNFLYFVNWLLIIMTKTQLKKYGFSIRLEFSIVTHHCNLNTQFYNEKYRPFAIIRHNLIIRFEIFTSRNRSIFFRQKFLIESLTTLNQLSRIAKIRHLFLVSKSNLQIKRKTRNKIEKSNNSAKNQ